MKMKKFFALLLSLSMALSLAACGSKGADESSDSQSGSDAASDLHLGYDLNTGEAFTAPITTNGATRPTKSFTRKP